MKIAKKDLIEMLASLDDDDLDSIYDEAIDRKEELEKEAKAAELDLKDIEDKRNKLIDALVDYLRVNPIAEALGWPHDRTIEEEKKRLNKDILEFEGFMAGTLLKNKMPCIAKELMDSISKDKDDEDLKNIVRKLIG